MNRETQYTDGLSLMRSFCARNSVPSPIVARLAKTDRLYQLATCAFYRPTTISIMVEKCALNGFGGRAWSWPGYAIDRTAYGVLQHELGHHVDHTRSAPAKSRDDVQALFSWKIHEQSREDPMTGYLGRYENYRPTHFYMEWFAEIFRVYVTNPDLCRRLRPRFVAAMELAGFSPVVDKNWDAVLQGHGATERIISQASKKILDAESARPPVQFEQQFQNEFWDKAEVKR